MARARNIKPGFFQNEELGQLSPLTRLAFIGMWTIADFKGCIEFRPLRLKIQLLPYDNCDIEEIAINLDKSGLIRNYSVQGVRYIKIINFERHQNPHKNERDAGSDLPDFEEKHSVIKDLKNIQNNPEQNGTTRADSLILIPDSKEEQAKKKPSPTFSLKAYIETCKAKQVKAIPDDAEVFTYVDKIALPREFLNLQWSFFKERYFSKTKRYTEKGWPKVFKDSVESNWFKLWFFDDVNQIYKTTTQGAQAKKAFGDGNA